MTTPTDPLYASQWHFDLIGRIETIWDEFDGSGVTVGVYDDGLDYNHTDLAGNYDASLHVVDDLGVAVDPFPVGDDAHGTAAGGLIGAIDNNGTGGVGVAHGVTLTGVNIFDSGTYGYVNGAFDPFMHVVNQAAANFDISSNSWGSTPNFGSSQNLANLTNFAGLLAGAGGEYDLLSQNGRGGLGTVIVQAAGNDTLDAGGSGVNASRFTLTVAATRDDGDVADYSNFGASILVAAPAGAVTTDVTGAPGYETGDYTTTFGGTSAATPVTAGVVALMLQANPNLGWRDVQNILAISAVETGSGYGELASGFEVEEWRFNSAENWNGGGMAVSASYGFGMIDAFGAVRMAEIWHLFDDAQISSNEVTATSTVMSTSTAIPDGDSNGVDFTVSIGNDIAIEHVALSMGFNSTYAGDVQVTITSPDGSVITALHPGNISTSFNDTWIFGIDHLLGETSAGTWTINVADVYSADALVVNSLQLTAYGQALDNNDVHHFTNAYFSALGVDVTRLAHGDTNGGTDWANMAGIGVDVDLNLVTGMASAEDQDGNPATLQILAAGHGIENVVMGDGNDIVTGNGAVNHLVGGRGDDILNGGGAGDTLAGGQGADTLNGGSGYDRLYGADDADYLTGFTGNDSLFGGAGDDTLLGQGGSDTLDGGNGVDSLNGGSGNDVIYGQAGADNAIAGNGSDSLFGGSGNDMLNGQTGSDYLTGGAGSDTLIGGSGNDLMEGGDGADSLSGGLGFDTMYGGNGVDILNGGSGVDRLFGGTSGDQLSGEGGNDLLYGDGGADLLNGGAGNDSLFGGSGADTLTGGTGADDFVFETSNGLDVITDWQNNIDDLSFASHALINSFADVLAAASQVGADVVISIAAGQSVTVQSSNLGQFDASDFIF